MTDIIDVIITLFTVAGSILGSIAFYFTWKEHKRKKPILTCYSEKSCYEVVKNRKYALAFRLDFVVNNTGSIGTTLTGCTGLLRYHRDVAKYTEGTVEAQPIRDEFPIDIPPDGSKKFSLGFEFENEHGTQFFDRCLVTLDLHNPKKWEWKDLPILAHFIFKHTSGTLETEACVFRDDLPESKKKYCLSIDEISESRRKFSNND